jgi:hypothetical protein
MPFDATLPAANSQISSTELRNQFNRLKTLVDVKVRALEIPSVSV